MGRKITVSVRALAAKSKVERGRMWKYVNLCVEVAGAVAQSRMPMQAAWKICIQ